MKKFFLSIFSFLLTTNIFAYKTAYFFIDTDRSEDDDDTLIVEDFYGKETKVFTHDEISLFFSANENNDMIRSSVGFGTGKGTFLYWLEDTMHLTPEEGYAITRVEIHCLMEPGNAYYAGASEGTDSLESNDTTDFLMRWDGYCTTSLLLFPVKTVMFHSILIRYEEIGNVDDRLLENEPDWSGVEKIKPSCEDYEYYNMQGMRVSKNNLTPGMYIVNGRKVLIR